MARHAARVTTPPPDLAAGLDALADEVDGRRLANTVERLSARYRAGAGPGGPLQPGEAAAYAVTRLPATWAASRAALRALAVATPGAAPETLLDAGGGSGAALWAAAEVFPLLRAATVVERDPAMTAVGRRLAAGATHPVVRGAVWLPGDLTSPVALPRADLALAAYALGELDEADLPAVTARLAAAAASVVVVEPGTPRGYRTILAVRAGLLAAGHTVAAPCPHDGPCPLAGRDWCHVAARVTRSPAHRRAKQGALGHEDEKLSYVATTTASARPATHRVLRHPQLRTGHVLLELCTVEGGVEHRTVAKREGGVYRRARNLRWGDVWEDPAEISPSG